MESRQLPPPLDGLSPAELLAYALDPPAPLRIWEPPSSEDLQRLLPLFLVESCIGHGGMGAVYKATQPDRNRTVAIKLLPAELAADRELAGRFQREARVLSELDHPGIVRLYETAQTPGGHPYFVMEYVDGTNLHQAIQDKQLDFPGILDIAVQICTALQFAHSRGIVHRDIKPANILLTHGGQVKLCDFGLARLLPDWSSTGFTLTRTLMGTPDYMAPEQKHGEGDHRIDIFSLGVTLYEMLCGKLPQGAWRLPSQLIPIDPRIDSVVVKALQNTPEDRYQQAEEMLAAIAELFLPPPGKIPPPRLRKSRRKTGAILSTIAGTLAFGAVTWLAVRPSTFTPSLSSRLASPPPAPPSSPLVPSSSWQDVFGPHRPLRDHHVVNSEGWIVVPSSHPQVQFVTLNGDKGIARLKVMWKSGTHAFQCALGGGGTDYTALDIATDGIRFNRKTIISKPIKEGDTFIIHLAWIENQVRIWVNGEFAGIRHAEKTPVHLTMRGNVYKPAVPEEVWVKDVQSMNLAGLSYSDALKAIHEITSPSLPPPPPTP